jgi:hypothetical protein
MFGLEQEKNPKTIKNFTFAYHSIFFSFFFLAGWQFLV